MTMKIIRISKKVALLLFFLIVLSTISACHQEEVDNPLTTPIADQTISSQEESGRIESSSISVSQEQDGNESTAIENSDNPAGESNIPTVTERFYISLSNDNSIDIMLDLPENWDRDAENIFDENERQVGSLWVIADGPQTYIPADANNPFDEAQEIIGSILNSPSYDARDFTVNNIPMRAYYYGTGEDGPDFLTDFQYSYFIYSNNEVLRITFHTRINDKMYTQADFDRIINSFAMAS